MKQSKDFGYIKVLTIKFVCTAIEMGHAVTAHALYYFMRIKRIIMSVKLGIIMLHET